MKDVYVFRFCFLAAGNSTLFRINRYPGELGCKLKSVGGGIGQQIMVIFGMETWLALSLIDCRYFS